MKKVNCILLVGIMTIISISCSNDQKLKKMVKDINAVCPLSISDTFTMESVEYANHLVTMTYALDSNSNNLIDMFRSDNEKARTMTLSSYSSASNKAFKDFIETIVDCNAALAVVYKGTDGGSYTMTFTANELKNNSPGMETGDPENDLQDLIDITKSCFPEEVEEGIVVTDLILEDRYGTYVCEVDEDLYDISLIKANKTEMKESILESFVGDKEIEAFCAMLKKTNRGLAYKYVGTTSGKSCLITIEPNEL